MSATHSVASVPAGLLEREEPLGALQGALAEAVAGSGRMVLVAGDAGVGKTALARALVDAAGTPERVLWGACDPLSTPRPLGPFADLAVACGGSAPGGHRAPVQPARGLRARCATSCRPTPAVVVVEDAHWADQATLDVLRLLGRRIRAAGAGRGDLPEEGDRRRRRAAGRARRPRRRRGRVAPDARRRSRARRCGRSPPGAASMPTSSTGARRATRSTSPRSSRRAAPRCRRPCATPCWRASRTSAPGARAASRSSPRAAGGRVLAARRGLRRLRRDRRRRAWPPGCSSPAAARSRSGTRSRARRSSAGSRRSAGRGCIAASSRRSRAAPEPGSGAPRPPRGERRGRRRRRALRAGGRRARGRRRRAPRGRRAVRAGAALRGRASRQRSAQPCTSCRAEALYAADDQVGSIADLYEAIALHRGLGDVGAEADATRAARPEADLSRSHGRGARRCHGRRRAARRDARAARERRCPRGARASPRLRG